MSTTPCPDCGTLVPAGTRFCPACQYPIFLDDVDEDGEPDEAEEASEAPGANDFATGEHDVRALHPPVPSPVPPAHARRPWWVPVSIVAAVALVSAAVVVAAALLTRPDRADEARDPFSGTWASVEGDGSNQELRFTGSNETRRVVLFDHRSARCGGRPSESTGRGRLVTARKLVVRYDVRCVGGRTFRAARPSSYVYDRTNGTLVENDRVIWSRPVR